jgi:hypothetical protein
MAAMTVLHASWCPHYCYISLCPSMTYVNTPKTLGTGRGYQVVVIMNLYINRMDRQL